ncbi:DUF4189 domain-containing protein [Rhizobium sp. TRM95111]|uniref:DUF4189 domain-containing protein n=1 Tax=Rhizobium alarense TaxID=2846851 RepID=UPI001F1CF346|nr:DUF4189 domain-containing protein [Rhizobium alarense]MCF3641954.1 DUF4189 domain-containing protein [Rhizobium alarense]
MRHWHHAPFAATFLVMSLATPGAAEDLVGAFAFSQNKHLHAFSGPKPSQAEAETAALEICRAQADDCQVTNYFQNACGALATAPDGAWGASWGNSEPAARQRALTYCAEHSTECTVLTVQCVGVSGFAAPPMASPQMN